MTPQEFNNKKLLNAAEAGNLGDAQAALAAGADPNARDVGQRTPLHWTARNGHADLARLLIEKGADPNAKNEWQETPLHYAARNGHADLARLLIQKGVDSDAKNNKQQTPLHLAVLGHADHVAKRRGNDEPQIGG